MATFLQRGRMARLIRERTLDACQCLVVAIELGQALASVDQRVGVGRSMRQCLFVTCERFLMAAEFDEGVAAIVDRFGIAGAGGDRPFEAQQGVVGPF